MVQYAEWVSCPPVGEREQYVEEGKEPGPKCLPEDLRRRLLPNATDTGGPSTACAVYVEFRIEHIEDDGKEVVVIED